MARVVRKVSGKAVRGQKKDKGILYSKRFWIICAIALVIVIAAGITIGVIVSKNNDKDEVVTVDDYFGMTQEYVVNGETHEINFEKMSYAGVRMHSNPNFEDTFIDYIFVFAADLNTFYPVDLYDNDDNNLKSKTHEKIFNYLKEFQYQIDLYNANNEYGYKVKLYIVDTAPEVGSENTALLLDSNYGGSEEEDINVIFSLKSEDGLITSYEGYKGDMFNEHNSLYCSGYSDSAFQTVITNSIKFMNLNFKDEVER